MPVISFDQRNHNKIAEDPWGCSCATPTVLPVMLQKHVDLLTGQQPYDASTLNHRLASSLEWPKSCEENTPSISVPTSSDSLEGLLRITSSLSFDSSNFNRSTDEVLNPHREFNNVRSSTYDSVQVSFGDEEIDMFDTLPEDPDDWDKEPIEKHIQQSDITCDTHVDECTQKALLKRVTPFSEFKQAHEDFKNAPNLDQLLALTKSDIKCAQTATLLGILFKADHATTSDIDHNSLVSRTLRLREDEKHRRRQEALVSKYKKPRRFPKEIVRNLL